MIFFLSIGLPETKEPYSNLLIGVLFTTKSPLPSILMQPYQSLNISSPKRSAKSCAQNVFEVWKKTVLTGEMEISLASSEEINESQVTGAINRK